MKIIYLGSIPTSDSDFPLIREFQRKGIEVEAYFDLSELNKKSGIINIDTLIKKNDIFPAKDYSGFGVYDGYLNLDNIYVINCWHHRVRDVRAWILWLKVLSRFYTSDADIIHIAWPHKYLKMILYLYFKKSMLTVHDPFPHSGQYTKYDEFCRKLAFRSSDYMLLFNKSQMKPFCDYYHIKTNKVLRSRMGDLSCFRYLASDDINVSGDYILFFGQIQPHKGLEYLLEAMMLFHKKRPNIKLIIAGNGKLYFDFDKYKDLDYIQLRNYYISVPELAGLLKKCLFTVIPYKDATQSGVLTTSFSMGTPVVATNVGAIGETVIDGVYGHLVPPCNVEALSDAMLKMVENDATIQRMKKNIMNKWLREMSWERVANDIIQTYNIMLK